MNRKSKLSFALTAVATLIVVTTVIFTIGSAQAATTHNKVVKTTVMIQTATQIGNTTLSPGKYRVRITPPSNESGDATVQFSILHNPYGDGFNPPYDEVLVLTVKASVVDLRAPAASTELIPTSGDNSQASALEIRGNGTEYVFGAKTASGE